MMKSFIANEPSLVILIVNQGAMAINSSCDDQFFVVIVVLLEEGFKKILQLHAMVRFMIIFMMILLWRRTSNLAMIFVTKIISMKILFRHEILFPAKWLLILLKNILLVQMG